MYKLFKLQCQHTNSPHWSLVYVSYVIYTNRENLNPDVNMQIILIGPNLLRKKIANHSKLKTAQQIYQSLQTWEALSFSVAGTCSTTRGFPNSLHRAARYILGAPKVDFGERISLFLADKERATGLKRRSGTVRNAAMLDRTLMGSSLSQKHHENRKKFQRGAERGGAKPTLHCGGGGGRGPGQIPPPGGKIFSFCWAFSCSYIGPKSVYGPGEGMNESMKCYSIMQHEQLVCDKPNRKTYSKSMYYHD